MLFNSVLYLVYLPIVVLAYYALPLSWRRLLLLAASYVFYWVWSIPLSGLLLLSTVVDWAAASVIDRSESSLVRRAALATSLSLNLGMLGLFKYADFVGESVESLTGSRPWDLNLILPLGISFYTFQTMSYTIDVYRGHMRARHSPIDVALYVSFFPQLVAGPIIRADTLIPQLRTAMPVDWTLVRGGIALILWGMAKKVFVADSMAPIVNEAYGNPELMSGWALLTATYAFAVQIYCDFSGYSDIAIGSALLLGVRLPANFDAPYLAASIREFWRRWHISLSTWLRDYLYIPLGGGRRGIPRTYANLMITMLLGGLWHGAGWNWVVWGGLQGVLMIGERLIGLSESRPKQWTIALLRGAITFHLVCLSWVFFRAADVGEAWTVLERIFTGAGGLGFSLLIPAIAVLILVVAERMHLRRRWLAACERSETLALWATVIGFVVIAVAVSASTNTEFIYFQF
ncbi:MAG: MBOAT family protein [Phycisphaerales bacterium]